MTVQEFFDMIFTNEFHNIRLKSKETDKALIEFSNGVPDIYSDKIITGLATDWDARIYVLWI